MNPERAVEGTSPKTKNSASFLRFKSKSLSSLQYLAFMALLSMMS
jgi:hypothetical protein